MYNLNLKINLLKKYFRVLMSSYYMLPVVFKVNYHPYVTVSRSPPPLADPRLHHPVFTSVLLGG